MNFDNFVNTGSSSLREWGVRVLGVLIAIFVAWVVAGWLARALGSTLERKRFDTTLTRFFTNAVRYSILTAALIGGLGAFGIETTSFAAVLASMGVAVGLALQGTLSNFAAGLMLLAFRPYKVGDAVRAAGETGKVEEIALFTTELTTPDNRRIIVPNSKIFGATIENISHYPTRRVSVPVGVSYAADVDEVRAVLEGAIAGLEGVNPEPAPQVFLKGLGASSVDWEVRLWCAADDYWAVHERGTRAVKKALDQKGIGIPYPTLDVNLTQAK